MYLIVDTGYYDSIVNTGYYVSAAGYRKPDVILRQSLRKVMQCICLYLCGFGQRAFFMGRIRKVRSPEKLTGKGIFERHKYKGEERKYEQTCCLYLLCYRRDP